MYTISQFARKCNVSSKTFRHYEKIGLLIPASIGTENLYRYYSREQTEEVKGKMIARAALEYYVIATDAAKPQ